MDINGLRRNVERCRIMRKMTVKVRAELHAEKKEEGVQRELLLPAGEPDDPARAI